jgi:hypothetical protein
MTTYSICLHLLGKNLANLKYFKEAKVFLNRAQYVALNLTTTAKPDLVTAINNDIKSINVNLSSELFTDKLQTSSWRHRHQRRDHAGGRHRERLELDQSECRELYLQHGGGLSGTEGARGTADPVAEG